MEKVWVLVLTVTGSVSSPDAPVEERAGALFAETRNATSMYFESEEWCNAARTKLLASEAFIMQSFEDGTFELSECTSEDFTVE